MRSNPMTRTILSDLRIKFYAKWKEFIKEQAVDPDQPRYLTHFVYPILVPAGPGWDYRKMDQKKSIDQIIERADRVLIHTYARIPVAFEKGQGCRVWDQDGGVYLDFLAGIAVTALGHSHPRVVERLKGQAEKIFHTSNLYHIESQIALAEQLVAHSFADKVFFCNSGTEANEGAIKLARRYSQERYGPHKTTILCMLNSFHGRTLGSLSATGQERFQKGFGPLVPGISFVPFDDLSALARDWDQTVCAVMMEPIQGEGGRSSTGPGLS